jgi:hypothetical protein
MSRTTHTPNTRGAKASAARGNTIAFFTALALSLATAIGAAAWLIGTQESTAMTTVPATQAPAATAAAPATPATSTTTASDNATTTATAKGATAAQATTPQPSAPSTPSAAGQRAFIDPVTGELRQPEHDELAAIAAAAAAAAPARRLAARTANAAPELFGTDGSIVAVVPEDLHTFTVATRGPDGRIVIEHAQGAKNAARLMKANGAKDPQAPVSRAQQKEDRNDR